MNKKIFSIVLILILIVVLAGCSSSAVDKNRYTSTVEANSFYIMSEISGRITDVSISQGDTVKKGDSVLKLDDTLYQIQKRQAQAALEIAEASQSGLTESPRQSIKTQSSAAIAQAQAAVDAAQLQIDKCTINSPTAGTVAAVYVSEGQVVSPSSPTASNIIKITDSNNKSYVISAEVTGKIKKLSISQGDTIKSGQNIAVIDSQSFQIQKKQALASLSAAKAQQSGLSENPKKSQLSQTQGSIDQAQASIDIAQLQIDKCNIISQNDGVIEDVYVNRGEMVSAGMNIAKVMDLSSKYLKVYVEESKRNNVKLGQNVPLYVNNKNIGSGTVIYIASESEFTPKNIETKSEKDKTVFEIKVKLDSSIDAAPGAMVDVEIK